MCGGYFCTATGTHQKFQVLLMTDGSVTGWSITMLATTVARQCARPQAEKILPAPQNFMQSPALTEK